MEKSDGESSRSGGQPCPPLQKLQGLKNKSTGTGGELQDFQTTLTELAAAINTLKQRAAAAPANVGLGRASLVIQTGLKFLAVVLLAAGVGYGLGDGDLFDDVGPNCAQQPSRLVHGAGAGHAKQPSGKVPGSAGGASGGKAESENAETGNQRPACEALAKVCTESAAGWTVRGYESAVPLVRNA